MLITSKYNGKCSKCGTFISQGTQIEWTKAGGATCAKGCHATKSSTPASPSKVGTCTGPAALYERLGFTKLDPSGEMGRVFRGGFQGGGMGRQDCDSHRIPT